MSPSEPKTLAAGRYLLTEPIGEGGMAVVYRAFDRRLQVWRAIKVLNPKYATSSRVRERFDAEAQTMALLEHPNIVRVYDVGAVGEISYIVMELVQGGSLVDWLERYGAMPPGMAVSAIDQICHGVTAAHAKGVIHRDLKPHNVLITLDGTCRITDFGIARVGDAEHSKTKTGAVMGTWGYMAPEQRSDAKGVDARADVYALAATLFTLVTNRIPMDLFAADRDKSMFAGVPPDLFEVLTKATEYHREARYESVEAFRLALVDVASRLPVDPPNTPALVSRRPSPLRSPTAEVIASATPLVEADGGSGYNPTLAPSTRSEQTPISAIRIQRDPPDAAPAPLPRRRWLAPLILLLVGGLMSVVALIVAAPLVLSGFLADTTDPAMSAVSITPEPDPEPAAATVEPDPAHMPEPETPEPEPQPTDEPPTQPVRPVRPPGPSTAPSKPDPVPATPEPDPVPATPEPDPEPAVAAADPVTPARIVEAPTRQQCINVQPPAGIVVGQTVPFVAERCVDDGHVVTLWFRPSGTDAWQSVTMPFRLGAHRAVVKTDDRYADGLDFYIETRGAAHGSRTAPHRVGVR